jgi:spore germination protein KA
MKNKLLQLLKKYGKKKKGRHGEPPPETAFTGRLDQDEELMRKTLARCGDVVYRQIHIPALNRKGLVLFAENMVDKDIINRDILAPLLEPSAERITNNGVLDLLHVGEAEWCSGVEEASQQLLLGSSMILVDGRAEALLAETRQWPARNVEEPLQEQLIQGPREGFTEVLKINTSLIRRRLPTPSLKLESLVIGRRTATHVALMYIDDVADPDVVQEARARLKAIDIDGILEPGALGELISDKGWSPFPLILNTERPDKVVGELLQGKVVILADGSPFAKIIPATFADFNHTPEDFYLHPLYASLFRVLRFGSFFVATTLTAIYVAILSFHYEMVPADLLVFLAETRAGVPFVPFIEALMLELAIELIRESSLRLPKNISGTIGIVGALVLGQAVVEARLVSPILLIVVAISFMASFTIPSYQASLPIRYVRFPILIAAGLL